MFTKRLLLPLFVIFCTCQALCAQNDGQEKPNPDEIADKEIERLERELKLEDWQVFYIDSTLRHNYSKMFAELESMSKAMVSNSDLYIDVQDKWMEKNEAAYKKYFNEKQWNEYLKNGGERIIRDRERRRAKALGIKPEKKKRKNNERED